MAGPTRCSLRGVDASQSRGWPEEAHIKATNPRFRARMPERKDLILLVEGDDEGLVVSARSRPERD
jgi:hypothetical protein